MSPSLDGILREKNFFPQISNAIFIIQQAKCKDKIGIIIP